MVEQSISRIEDPFLSEFVGGFFRQPYLKAALAMPESEAQISALESFL